MNQLLNKRAAVALSLVSAFIASLLPVAVFGQTSGVVNWAQASSSGSTPPARDFAAMDYDSAHAVTVLFGGSAQGSGDFRDTWTWNGSSWSQMLPQTSPPTVVGGAMAYDSRRGVSVLFGGSMS